MLGLTYLAEYTPTILASALFFTTIQFLSPFFSPLLSSSYKTLPPKTRREWDVRVVSTANILTVLPLAIRCFRHHDELARDKAFAVHPEALRLAAVAAGYFLWDSIEEAIKLNVPFVIHGVATLFIFVFGLRPFVLYYAPISLMWELSTPFLNIHWFLDKTNRTGGTFQLINGILLLVVFFSIRLVYGGWASYDLFKTLYRVRHDIPVWVTVVYGVGNVTLNILNWTWFFKMIDALRRRFQGEKKKEKGVNQLGSQDPLTPSGLKTKDL